MKLQNRGSTPSIVTICAHHQSMHTQENHLVSSPPEHDLGIRIGRHRGPDRERPRSRRVLFQLDVIRHHHMSQHGFQLSRSKETSRANASSASFSWQLETICESIPCVSTKPKCQILGRRRGELMLDPFSVLVVRTNKSEGFKGVRVGV